MNSQIIASMFVSDSFELLVTNNKGIKGKTCHDSLDKARRIEIYWWQQQIISDLREILIKAESLDKTGTSTDDVIFISRIQELIRDAKDFGANALTYQLAFHCRPLLEKIKKKIPAVKITIQDIAWLQSKCTSFYGAYKVENPEPSEEQTNQMRTPLFTWE